VLFRKGPSEPVADTSEADAAAEAEAAAARVQPKGRPTPSRKEAEAARKARVKPVLDKKSAAKANREEARANRVRAREAMSTGDQRYLPARDKGPVRAFARDYVDARRTLGEFMLPALILFVPLTLLINTVPSTAARGYIVLATYVYILMVVVGTAWTGLRAKSAAAARFPDEDVRGTVFYAAMRSLQLRRWRLPKPRVKVGDPF
jgi:hypothetical protein